LRLLPDTPMRQPLLLLLLAVCLAHGLSLWNDFVFDDTDIVLHNDKLGRLSGLLELRWSDRPVREISLWIDNAVWGLRPAGYHLTNLALHYLCALLVYRIGLVVLVRKEAALAAALLFAVHPATTESVACVSHRKEMLAAGFMMGSFLLFLRRPRTIAGAGGSALLYGAAVFSKASAGTLPALIAATEWLTGKWKLRSVVRYLPFLAVALFFLVAKEGTLRNYSRGKAAGKAYYQRFNPEMQGDRSYQNVLRNSLFAHGRSMRCMLLPVNLSAEHSSPGEGSVAGRAGIGSIASLLILTGLFFRYRKRRPDIAFCATWLLITPLPTSNLVPVTYFFAERYLYIPLAGFCWLAGIGMSELLRLAPMRKSVRFRRLAVAGLVLVLAACTAVSARRVIDWKNNESLLASILETNPGAPNASYQLAGIRSGQGKHGEAIVMLRETAGRFPDSPIVHERLGSAFWEMGNLDSARVHLGRAVELQPKWSSALGDLGVVCCQHGDFEEGIEVLRRAIAARPDHSDARYNLGLACLHTGRIEEAWSEFHRALELKPGDISIALPLGEACLLSGRNEEAKIVFGDLLAADPATDAAVWGLARADLALGDSASCRARVASLLADGGLSRELRTPAETLARSLDRAGRADRPAGKERP